VQAAVWTRGLLKGRMRLTGSEGPSGGRVFADADDQADD
jgi:hypothetical protein